MHHAHAKPLTVTSTPSTGCGVAIVRRFNRVDRAGP